MNTGLLKDIVIIGLGNQGETWAKNLRDSGVAVAVCARPQSKSEKKAQELGLTCFNPASAELKKHQVFALLTPDHTHLSVLQELQNVLPKEACVLLAHGFSLLYENLAERFPQWNFLLLAPKPIAREFRALYEQKKKVPALISVEALTPQGQAKGAAYFLLLLQDIAELLGCLPFAASAEVETKSDLLSEQTLLCALLPYGALLSYKKLREMGATPEAAYFECWYELRLIANTLVSLGPKSFFSKISPNALLGAQKGQELLFGTHYQAALEKLKNEVQNGQFAEEVKACDFSRLREQVDAFWAQEELQEVHDRLKHLFY